ncbi:MAG TPA: DUF4870 domain-containing protein [Gemmatimonadales bacterium]|jgi:uncharacterized membrane protein|nr:DUF4870 domain-containing protein [Gemmatimonadales bacterium]
MSSPVPSPSNTPSTSGGLTPNLAGALSYLLGPVTGIIFLLLERTNKFVRFHAMQSTVLGVAWIVFSIALSVLSGIVPVIGWIFGLLISIVLGIGGFILWLLLMWNAYQGKEWELPVVGPFARKQLTGGGA